MKKKFIHLRKLIIMGFIGAFFVFLYFYHLRSGANGELSAFCNRQEYKLNDDRYVVYIDYPQLSGMRDQKKEIVINELIKKDVMKILERDDPNDDWRFYAVLDYKIKYMNDQIISILYEGADGPMLPARGNPAVAMVTTIDIKEERILSLDEVIADYNLLHDMLMADKFENISKWDGVEGQYTISQDYEYKEVSTLMEDLNGNDEDIEWYLDDGHFVIVVLNGLPDYNEYAISLQDARAFLKKDFLKKIN